MLFILKGREQLPSSTLVSNSAVSYSSCCFKHLLTGGRAHCEERHCCLLWLLPNTGLTPLFVPGTERVRSSQLSLSTAVGYILVDENHFRSISFLRTEGQCSECSWMRSVSNGISVSGWALLWRSQHIISPSFLRNRAFPLNSCLGSHFVPENLETERPFYWNPSFTDEEMRLAKCLALNKVSQWHFVCLYGNVTVFELFPGLFLSGSGKPLSPHIYDLGLNPVCWNYRLVTGFIVGFTDLKGRKVLEKMKILREFPDTCSSFKIFKIKQYNPQCLLPLNYLLLYSAYVITATRGARKLQAD